MTFQYSEEDLRAAMHANMVDNYTAAKENAGSTFKSLEDRIGFYESLSTTLNLSDPEDIDYFNRNVIPESVARYRRGQEVQQESEVITSPRSIVLGDGHYEDLVKGRTVVSPAIACWGGHIATNEAYYWAVLVLKEKKEAQ